MMAKEKKNQIKVQSHNYVKLDKCIVFKHYLKKI